MKKSILTLTLAILCAATPAQAEGPIFLQKMKAAFSNDKSSSQNQASSPVKVTNKAAKQKQTPGVIKDQKYIPPESSNMQKRKQLRSAAFAKVEQNREQRQELAEQKIQQIKSGLGSNGTQPVNQASGQNAQQKAQKRIIIKTPSDKDEGSSGPKPIFKNFR